MSCHYEVNDGAYILGALTPADRAEFENHLATCPSCRASVGALAVLPGLLGRLDPATLVPAASGSPELLPRILATARSRRRVQRRRQILTTVSACVATAALATALGLGAQLFAQPPQSAVVYTDPVVFTEMQSAATYVPLDAEIGIRPDSTGTLVSVRCLYHGASRLSWPIWLVVYPRGQSNAEAIGSWVARTGLQVNVTAITHFTPAQIDRIELQGDDRVTIAWWRP